MDIPEDEETPITLDRPFLLTSRCNFDIETGNLTINFFYEEITLQVLEIKKQGAGGKNKSFVGMIKVEGENKMEKSFPKEVLGIISQVASITNPKFTQVVKKRRKQVYKSENMEVGKNKNHTVASDFD